MKTWLAERGVHYLFLLFSAALGVAVAVVSVWADGATGADKQRWALIAGVAACGVVLITHFEKRFAEDGEERAKRLASDTNTEIAKLYTNTLGPLSNKLKDLAVLYADEARVPAPLLPQTVVDLDDKRRQILDQVLAGAVDLTAPPVQPDFLPRGRCSFYRYDPATGDFNLEGTYPGYRPPRPVIDPVGAAHMKNEILGGGGKPFRIDGKLVTQSYLIPEGSGYEAVIAVPVIHGTEEIGVLSVDAPRFADLVDRHVPLMEALADILAAAYALK
ncbi:hypothetical protein [Streptomyces sp. NPDC056387]|uniref:hypothetical protein n=1 Tax=Streptomyces sp. NPDC056387 TaxID=3345803 RepID=UPI0035E00B26